jgi:hypothetical protein
MSYKTEFIKARLTSLKVLHEEDYITDKDYEGITAMYNEMLDKEIEKESKED